MILFEVLLENVTTEVTIKKSPYCMSVVGSILGISILDHEFPLISHSEVVWISLVEASGPCELQFVDGSGDLCHGRPGDFRTSIAGELPEDGEKEFFLLSGHVRSLDSLGLGFTGNAVLA